MSENCYKDKYIDYFTAFFCVLQLYIKKGQQCQIAVPVSYTHLLPAQRLHNVNLLRQKVQAQRPAKQRDLYKRQSYDLNVKTICQEKIK